MISHMKKCKDYLDTLESDSQQHLSSGGHNVHGGKSVRMTKPFDHVACKQATVKMIIMDELPFSFVENEGFRQFCETAIPWFRIPSRRTITREVVGILYKQAIFFTTDIWTAITTLSYMVITAHFNDMDWQLHRRIISFSPIPDHKGETIANQFIKSLDDWGIGKVFAITLDNASSNDKAISILKDRLLQNKNDALMMNGEFMHIRCCAHILNLIANEGLDDISKSIISVRNAVKYVRSSTSRLESFKRWAEVEKITRGSVVLDCVTRWNSTYLMLNGALKYRTAFERMADMDKPYDAWFKELDSNGKVRKGPPTSVDWDKARHMWEGTEKVNKILILAGILDPLCKMFFTEYNFEIIYGRGNPKCKEMSKLVMDVLGRIFKVYSDWYNTLNLQYSAAHDGENVTESSQGYKDMEDYNIDDPFLKFMAAKRTTSEVVNELEHMILFF
ncbi:hypothetical protein N665_0200s0015 [Sinapis alba]|nr:hypothetical protein N665_0200s0015 [Sinapis alba]